PHAPVRGAARHCGRATVGAVVSESRVSERTLTAAQAAGLVRPGARLFGGTACATPRPLVRALEELADPPAGVTLVHALTDRVDLASEDETPFTSYRHRVFYVGRDVRELLSGG